ncbi:ArsR/SmtB family transcription factor [Allosalinactinospora lopnorensis]|uniref:ArsR/SmtB family transcription factor n=1 Tax=Allosalinactinospora lopnorensis TaxID=1352348 RepID=UPI003084689C
MYAALADPHRRRIMDLLRQGELPAGALVDQLKLSQPGVSKHLKVLREAGLVEVQPRGKERIYRLRAGPLSEVDAWLAPYRAYWNERLDDLEAHLDQGENHHEQHPSPPRPHRAPTRPNRRTHDEGTPGGGIPGMD